MSSDPSSSFSTTSRTLPSPCRCTISPLALLDKVSGLVARSPGTEGLRVDL